jgi:hypothetical protein
MGVIEKVNQKSRETAQPQSGSRIGCHLFSSAASATT